MKAYLCPAGRWTIGYGHTEGVKKGDVLETVQQADELLELDLRGYELGVMELVSDRVALTQGQFDALVAFSFNVGLDIDGDVVAEGLGDSSLLRYVNAGNFAAAAAEFDRWVWATVKGRRVKLPGLIRRRAAERKLFETGVWP
jgi:lysozyme